jgi:endonuclease YncB( thermonuclease family)
MPPYHRLERGEQVRFSAWVVAHTIFGLSRAPCAALAQSITDGDTLKLNGVTYRLWGIDAPETKQDLPDGWAAGRLATTHLQSLILGRNVICERKYTDRYGRTVAVCRAGGEDLGELNRSAAARLSDDSTQDRAGLAAWVGLLDATA